MRGLGLGLGLQGQRRQNLASAVEGGYLDKFMARRPHLAQRFDALTNDPHGGQQSDTARAYAERSQFNATQRGYAPAPQLPQGFRGPTYGDPSNGAVGGKPGPQPGAAAQRPAGALPRPTYVDMGPARPFTDGQGNAIDPRSFRDIRGAMRGRGGGDPAVSAFLQAFNAHP